MINAVIHINIQSCKKTVGSQWRKMKMDGAELAKTPNGSLLLIRLTEGGHMLQARISEMSKDLIIMVESTDNYNYYRLRWNAMFIQC